MPPWLCIHASAVWPRSAQTERCGVHMKQRHFSRRFFLFGGLLSLLICVLTLAAPSALALSGKIREFAIPTAGSLPEGITAGAAGNLLVTATGGTKNGGSTTRGTITQFAIPPRG